jgi:hypothetical protein
MIVTVHHQVVAISRIRIDGGTQTRVTTRQDIVEEYADLYRAGVKLPDIVVFNDGTHLWLADGFHRLYGAVKARLAEIQAAVREGNVRDALLYSAGCNGTHGLRRSNEDKRLAVKMLLADEEWASRSNNWIAERCRVSDHLVANVREESTSNSRSSTSGSGDSTSNSRSSPGEKPRRGKDGKTRKPRKKKPKPADQTTREPGDDSEAHGEAHDAEGTAVPQQALAAFSCAKEMEAWGRKVDELVREMEALAEGPGGRLIDFQAARLHFKNGKATVLQNRPTHVCPLCGGRPAESGEPCDCCKGEGWTAEHVFKRLVKEESR